MSLIDQIAALAARRPFTARSVSELLDVRLEALSSNPWFTIYRGSSEIFSEVELREPTAKSPNKAGIVVLDFATPFLKVDDVGQRFGEPQPGPRRAPSPEMPAESPSYAIHPQPWGQVRLGYSPSDQLLVAVVLDGNG